MKKISVELKKINNKKYITIKQTLLKIKKSKYQKENEK